MVSKSLSIPRLGFISSIAFLGIFVPAKRPSFWIKGADFTRHYQKIGGTWLPLRDQTVSQVRLFGENVLTIEHNEDFFYGLLGNSNSFIRCHGFQSTANHA